MTTMFIFPGMYHPHIKDSNLKMPADFDNYDPAEYPHFHLFLMAHTRMAFDPTDLEYNANIIAEIPKDRLKEISFKNLMELGIRYSLGPLD